MNERRIAKIKKDIEGLEAYIDACQDAMTKPALYLIHRKMVLEIETLRSDNLRRYG
ncbi:hypothetical protein LXL81_07195 [Dyadobacter sp. CY356]|nr:hypothetical protein [Dyadobacter sp. CY356]